MKVRRILGLVLIVTNNGVHFDVVDEVACINSCEMKALMMLYDDK